MPLDKIAYTAGHFELEIDQAKTTAYLKSVEGGFMGHSVVDEPIGGENKRIKHTAVVDVDPISVEMGMSGSTSVMKWIQDSWNKKYQERSGQITHANFNMEKVFEHEFSDALITEVTFPTLDGASKEAAYLKVKFQPRTVKTTKVRSTQKIAPIGGLKQKMWLCSSFRLSIGGMHNMEFVNKIESFTIKQNVKKTYVGVRRDLELCPTKIEFPNLTCTISLEKADEVLDWYQTYVVEGRKDNEAQREGTLDFLSPDRKTTLMSIQLKRIGLVKAQLNPSTANSDQIKRVKFELYVGEMQIELGGTGLE